MLFFIIIATFVAAVNAEPKFIYPHGRIVGGENTEIKFHPHQVSLLRFGSHSCGGSIISENYVITAGHCAQDGQGSLTIRAGTTYRTTGGSIHKVEQVIVHENFGTNFQGVPSNDVAVLKVDPPFIFDETRQPVELFKDNENAEPGAASVITGWGSTGRFGLPNQLQQVTVPIVSKKLCNKTYSIYGGIPKGQICAAFYGVGGKDACQGDSGGPLTIDGKLAGLVSWGNGCAQAYYPGVYTEVSYYRDWIRSKTNVQ